MSAEDTEKPTTSTTAEDDVEAENPNVNFEPVIRLKTVETKTFEEEEDVLFKMRAKLFRWDKDVSGAPCWRERGTGDVKFLKHKNNNKIRLVMRREKTHKVCANFYIMPNIKLKVNPTSDRSWIWTVMDYSEEPREELFAIRFANPENANKFKEDFENIQNGVIPSGSGEAEAPPAPTEKEEEIEKEKEKEATPTEKKEESSTESKA